MNSRAAAAVLAFGVVVRILARGVGHGTDVMAWQSAAQIMADGNVVYATTSAYNYGPIWFLLLDALRRLTEWMPWPWVAFRLSITVLLILADVGIYCLLLRFLSFRVYNERRQRPHDALFLEGQPQRKHEQHVLGHQ